MTPAELDEIWCVGSPGGHMYPKGISPKIAAMASQKWTIKYLLFVIFAIATCDHSKHHNLVLHPHNMLTPSVSLHHVIAFICSFHLAKHLQGGL